jgi:hypothetical protein
VAKAVVDTVSGTLSHTIRGTGAVAVTWERPQRERSWENPARNERDQREALDVINATAGSIIKATSEVTGNFGNAAKGAIQGAISRAKSLSDLPSIGPSCVKFC